MDIRRIVAPTLNTEIVFNEDSGVSDISIGYGTRKKGKLDLGVPLKVVGTKLGVPTPTVESHMLERGFSHVRIPFYIFGEGATSALQQEDMESKWHDLTEILEETALFFDSNGGRGSRAEFQYKEDGASELSFKTIFFGWVDEKGARGNKDGVECGKLEDMELHLICEPRWRPGVFNYLFNGDFEYWYIIPYGGSALDIEPDGWTDVEKAGVTGTNNREPTDIKWGDYALKIIVTNITGAPNDRKGVYQDIFSGLTVGVTYTLLAWVKNTAITNGKVQICAFGSNSGYSYALDSNAAHSEFTLVSCTFTPNVADTYLWIHAHIAATAVPGCSGTAYIDGMMVVKGVFAPSDFLEWHPNPQIRIGPNLLSGADFEEWHAGGVDMQPDCWFDYEITPTNLTNEQNNIESTWVEQGCHALKISVDDSAGAGSKGVYQDIVSRLDLSDSETYVLLGWVRNGAIAVGTVILEVEGDGGGGWVVQALDSAAANSEYTRYAVLFTPNAADTWVHVRAYIDITGANGSGTVYFDKLMVIRALIANGHSYVPDEWTGCGYVFSHYDGKYSIRNAAYKWTQSPATATEFYLELAAGGDPGINEPPVVYENAVVMTPGTVGGLAAGEWDWGDNDALGFDTVYVRLTVGGDPDAQAVDWVEAGNDLGHVPYLDCVDLKGDTQSLLRFQIEPAGDGGTTQIYRVRAFRRTRKDVCAFTYHLEAEDGAPSNWPDVVDAECSAGDKSSQGAGQTSGNLSWTISANMDDLRGRIKIYGRVRGDAEDTQFSIVIQIGSGFWTFYTGDWVYLLNDNAWALFELTDVQLPPSDVPEGQFSQIKIWLYYRKADADVAECDFIQLMPVDESMVDTEAYTAAAVGEYFDVDLWGINNDGVDYDGVFDSGEDFKHSVVTHAELQPMPDIENRFFFHFFSGDDNTHTVNNDRAIAHCGIVTLYYLSQYESPIE